MQQEPDVFFEEDGHLTGVVEFDYDQVERELSKQLYDPECQKELANLTAQEVEAALKLFRALIRWVWQDGMANQSGLTIRSIILCWLFIEELREHTLTEMAKSSGRHKQSLGRWVETFKREFPYIRSPHIRHTKTGHSKAAEPN